MYFIYLFIIILPKSVIAVEANSEKLSEPKKKQKDMHLMRKTELYAICDCLYCTCPCWANKLSIGFLVHNIHVDFLSLNFSLVYSLWNWISALKNLGNYWWINSTHFQGHIVLDWVFFFLNRIILIIIFVSNFKVAIFWPFESLPKQGIKECVFFPFIGTKWKIIG